MAKGVGAARLLALALTSGATAALAQTAPAEVLEEVGMDAANQNADRSSADSKDGLPARVTTGYPARALRDGLTGTVSLTVTVTPEGRATDCVVNQSSGHPELDFAACKDIQEKARFTPAADADGKPTTAQFSTKVTFRIN